MPFVRGWSSRERRTGGTAGWSSDVRPRASCVQADPVSSSPPAREPALPESHCPIEHLSHELEHCLGENGFVSSRVRLQVHTVYLVPGDHDALEIGPAAQGRRGTRGRDIPGRS